MDNIFQLINRVEKAYKGKGIFKFTSKDNTITYLLSIFLWIIGSVALFIANTKKCCISVYISSWIFYLVSFLILFYVDRTIQREENFFFQKNKNKSNEDDAEKFLHIDYSIDKIDILATWMYNAIQGQIGEYFLDKRSNFLYDICILLCE